MRSRATRISVAAALAALTLAVLTATSGGSSGHFGGCTARGLLPDPSCTPGATFRVGTAAICRSGYSRSVRDVPYSLKRRVYYSYGIRRHPRGTFEVDHLVPLELGGSNAQSNLWPEAAPGFHEKDALENYLHQAVCSGARRLSSAQAAISRNWHAEWLRDGRP